MILLSYKHYYNPKQPNPQILPNGYTLHITNNVDTRDPIGSKNSFYLNSFYSSISFIELLGLVLKQEKIREKKMEMENTFAVSQLSY